MELHHDFSKNEYGPQSEAQLQNFKTLLLLEIALLMGADLEWATGGAAAASAGPAGGPVLNSGGAGDDGDISDSDSPLFAAPLFSARPRRRGVRRRAHVACRALRTGARRS